MNTNSAKGFSWRNAALLFVSVGLLTAGLSMFVQSHSVTVQAFAAKVVAAPEAAATPGVGTSFTEPNIPVRLIIPAIGVDANIQSIGLYWRDNTTMGIPTNFTDVAWYNGGPRPGMPGSAVIDGHLDGQYVQKAVFYNLGALKPGDVVEVVESGGTTLEFKVIDSKLYDTNANTADIFSSDTTKARLNLITCAGDWSKTQNQYDKRIVVFTELVTTP
jgi:LPXTG-site transpeptidase (sortase) family protein